MLLTFITPLVVIIIHYMKQKHVHMQVNPAQHTLSPVGTPSRRRIRTIHRAACAALVYATNKAVAGGRYEAAR